MNAPARPRKVISDLGQYSGPPRSFLWRRGAVHLRRGDVSRAAPDLHAHFTIQITVGITHDVALRIARDAPDRLAVGWLIGSDQPHWGRGQGAGVTIFLDPLSPDGQRVSAVLKDRGTLPLDAAQADRIREELISCWKRGWTGDDLQLTVRHIVALLVPDSVQPVGIDSRIQTVVDELALHPSENLSLGELAARVGLSESRLAHLFRQEVGIPMRQYRLSLRMQEAVGYIAAGKTLTEAAHMAGFADSAHFSRICRRMSGTAPSGLPHFETDPGLSAP